MFIFVRPEIHVWNIHFTTYYRQSPLHEYKQSRRTTHLHTSLLDIFTKKQYHRTWKTVKKVWIVKLRKNIPDSETCWWRVEMQWQLDLESKYSYSGSNGCGLACGRAYGRGQHIRPSLVYNQSDSICGSHNTQPQMW